MAGILIGYPGQEIDCRSRALLFELQVQSGVPICHLKPPATALDVNWHRTIRTCWMIGLREVPVQQNPALVQTAEAGHIRHQVGF